MKPTDLYQSYLQSKRKEKRSVRLVQITILILFFSFWELAARMTWIDPLLFSMPTRVLSLLYEHIMAGTLWLHASVTMFETVLGFLLGTIVGTCLAALLWWSTTLAKIVDPFLVILNSMPKVAIGPILIVGIGPNMGSIIAMGMLVSVIITTMVVHTAFKEVDENYIKVMRTFSANKKQIFRQVIYPASIPVIVSTLKMNVGLAWVGVIVGEFLVSKQGLGYLIIYGFQVFNFNLVFMSLFVIAILATFMYLAVEYAEKRMTRFHP
ncbi:hydroxymethylpyrimidine ABC transporter, transmembrane component [Bacillus sp. JCM 19046]|uniref:NitT/TauT family transport system permease protein n=1 Tax=Shouchella xiaoxiensis TaxID=766895 RepID=A0ABS2SU95_9BACI|nr:ABC transporter permease [Shouchella xiaoxiensis]MBM7838380.1 NitT/TauT family transport system permease protein [Shouchella xiaoxiensis]GAF15864.1 hydroxymethylpyrimidine ABC transporter, transmembrane component [Bacillus sp. JCM 19046]